MSLSLGLTKGFDILSFMVDLFETTTSIRKLSKKYGVDGKILHNWMNILSGYAVHHINGNKTDNRGKNLVLMLHKDHTKLHRNKRLGKAIDEESLYVHEYSV